VTVEVTRSQLEEVAKSAHVLWERGLSPGDDAGDTSLRDAATGWIYILPRPSADRPIPNWGVVGPDDIAVVDGDGIPVLDNGVQPTVELATHLGIYRARPEAMALVHSHGEWSQVFSVLREDIPTYTSETYLVGGLGPIPCARSGGVATQQCADEAVRALGTRAKAVLLPSHGAVCLGSSFEQAFHVAEMTERAARQAVHIRLLGGAPQMTLEDLIGGERLQQLQRANTSGEPLEAVLARSL
jgi:L-fuculose-phosphate aldolase